MKRIALLTISSLFGACSLLEIGDTPDQANSIRVGFVDSASLGFTKESTLFGSARDEEVEGSGWSLGWERRIGSHFSSIISYRSFSLQSLENTSSGRATGGEVGVRGYLLDESSWSPFASLSILLLEGIPFAGGEEAAIPYSLELGVQWRPTATVSFEGLWKTIRGGGLSVINEEKYRGEFFELAANVWF